MKRHRHLLLIFSYLLSSAVLADHDQWYSCDDPPCSKQFEAAAMQSFFIWIKCNGSTDMKLEHLSCTNNILVDCVKSKNPTTCECTHMGLAPHTKFELKITSCE
ncbi:MAG: hypothetical protein AAF699_04875 [Pseudomonadota bacterium]